MQVNASQCKSMQVGRENAGTELNNMRSTLASLVEDKLERVTPPRADGCRRPRIQRRQGADHQHPRASRRSRPGGDAIVRVERYRETARIVNLYIGCVLMVIYALSVGYLLRPAPLRGAWRRLGAAARAFSFSNFFFSGGAPKKSHIFLAIDSNDRITASARAYAPSA